MADTTDVTLPGQVEIAMRNPKRIFGRYILLEELGRGGMGKVYKAWQMDLRRFVAIKFLLGSGDAQQLKRFYREAQTAAQLSHPNITPVYEISIYDDKPFIAMEYLDGGSLDKMDVPWDEKALRRIVFLMRDVARAVHHAHSNGVIHRDLKPANIMVTQKGKAYVTDFGLARKVECDIKITGTGLIMGTPAYMSPEQAQGGSDTLDAATDIWSLGATLYDLLCGRPPFKGPGAVETLSMVVHADPKAPSKFNRTIPKDLEAICLKALEKSKGKRFSTALEFARDLERFLRGEPVLAKARGALSTGIRFSKKRYPFLLVAAGMIGIGVYWLAGVVSDRSELKILEVRADEFHQQENWSECLRVCQEIEARGGGSDWVAKLREEAQTRFAVLASREREMDNRTRSQPKHRLAVQKLREARALAPRAGAGIDRVRKRYEEAIWQLEETLKIDPDHPGAVFTMAEAYNDLRDERGLPYAENLVRLHPEDPMAWLLRSRLRLWRYIRETGLVDAVLIRALEYDRIAEEDLILSDLEKAVELGVSDFHMDTATGLKWFLDGDFEGAWRSFEKAYARNPGDRDLLLIRAACCRRANVVRGNSLPDAAPHLEESYRAQPNDLLALLPLAYGLVKSDPARAISLLESAGTRDPLAAAYPRRLALHSLDREEDLSRMTEKAVKETLHPWILQGDAERIGFSKTLRLLGEAGKRYPHYRYFVDMFRYTLLVKMNRVEEAKKICRALLDSGSFRRLAGRAHEESRLYGDLAAIARKEEKYREAIRLATKSIRIYPRAHTYLALATSFLGLKEYGKAIDMAGRGLALLDDSDPLYPTLEKVIDVSRKWIEYEGDDP